MTETFGEAGISRSPLRGLPVNRVLAAGRRLPLWFSGFASTDLNIYRQISHGSFVKSRLFSPCELVNLLLELHQFLPGLLVAPQELRGLHGDVQQTASGQHVRRPLKPRPLLGSLKLKGGHELKLHDEIYLMQTAYHSRRVLICLAPFFRH